MSDEFEIRYGKPGFLAEVTSVTFVKPRGFGPVDNSCNDALARSLDKDIPSAGVGDSSDTTELSGALQAILNGRSYSIRLHVEPIVSFTILGEPASKANSRDIVTIGGRPSSIKSKKALAYERDALAQIPASARLQLLGELSVTMHIFYATQRPDLDESLILDILQNRYKTVKFGGQKVKELVQKGVYVNDRQVREKHIYHAIDKFNPRTVIEIRAIHPELPL